MATSAITITTTIITGIIIIKEGEEVEPPKYVVVDNNVHYV